MGLQALLKYLPFRPAEAEFEPISVQDLTIKDVIPLENLRKKPIKKPTINNYRDKIEDLLRYHNIRSAYKTMMLKHLDNVNYANVNSALEMMVINSFEFDPLKFTQSKPLMVLGMPGIGKTASIAKMATEAKYYGRKVNIITTDIKRAGGVEQLQNFCRLLEVEMKVARNPKQLKEALKGKEDEITLIDSAGANPYEPDDIELLRQLLKAGDIEPIFVLQAGGDADEAVELAQSLKPLGIRRMIVTKVDSAKRFGGIIAAALSCDLVLANFSATSNIGKGLEPFTPKSLVAQILKSYVTEDKIPQLKAE